MHSNSVIYYRTPPFQDVCMSSFQNRPSQTISHSPIAGLSKKHFSLFGGHQNSLQGLSKILYSVHFVLLVSPNTLYCLSFCYNFCKFLHNFFVQFNLSYLSRIIFNPLIASLLQLLPLALQSRQFGKIKSFSVFFSDC